MKKRFSEVQIIGCFYGRRRPGSRSKICVDDMDSPKPATTSGGASSAA